MHTMKHFALLLTLAASAGLALADDDKHRYNISDPTYKAECASCHIAYPPSLLPARSWRALMAGLDKHFDTDASLDAPTAARITAFLEQHAGRDRTGSSTPVLRITETRWFVHEHDEVSARTWKNQKVKSAANCTACHVDGDQGNFNEHGIDLPK